MAHRPRGPVKCSCGIATTNPYLIRGELRCAVCAEELDPRMVDRRVKRDYRAAQIERYNPAHFDSRD